MHLMCELNSIICILLILLLLFTCLEYGFIPDCCRCVVWVDCCDGRKPT